MEQLIIRLIAAGYAPDKALEIYTLYERRCDLDGLESFIVAKEDMRLTNDAIFNACS